MRVLEASDSETGGISREPRNRLTIDQKLEDGTAIRLGEVVDVAEDSAEKVSNEKFERSLSVATHHMVAC